MEVWSVIAGAIVAARGQLLLPARISRHDVRVLILETERMPAMCREVL
jgi:proline racemase